MREEVWVLGITDATKTRDLVITNPRDHERTVRPEASSLLNAGVEAELGRGLLGPELGLEECIKRH